MSRRAIRHRGPAVCEHIQDVLGHSSPTVTKAIYGDATSKDQRYPVDRLGFRFGE